MMKKKRKKFWIILLVILVIASGIWFFSTFVPETTYTEIVDEKINNEITIVQISDLHGMSFGTGNSVLLDKIKAENPDIVVVTGDMYTNGDSNGRKIAVSLMKSLAENYVVYFVNGEHDNNDDYFEELSSAGVRVLDYKEDEITIGETTLHFYGITNVYFTGTFDLSNAFVRDDHTFTILLSHMQNFEKFASFGIDLSLCGDTHGGMVRLPYIGTLYDGEEWFPDLNEKRTRGLYSFGDSLMYVNAGLGNYPFPIRFCNRPEISVIKLFPE